MSETAQKEKQSRFGIIVLLFKLAPKFIPIFSKLGAMLLKMLKGGAVVKAVGAAASLGLYSYLLTWQMGVALVLFLVVHEYGHLRAMHKCGLKTKGIYLIPGVGAIALSSQRFGSCKNEAYIAIMGPVYGFVFVAPLVALYFWSGNMLFLAIVSFVLFINLLNLLPINPLDGGRIVKSIVYSLKESWGFFCTFLMFVVAIALAFYLKFGLLGLIAAVGFFEAIESYGLRDALANMTKTVFRVVGMLLLYFLKPWHIIIYHEISLGSVLFFIFGLIILALFIRDAIKATKGVFFTYPIVILGDLFRGVTEIFSLKTEDLKHTEEHPPMDRHELVFYSVAYLAVIFVHLVAIVYTANITKFGFIFEALN